LSVQFDIRPEHQLAPTSSDRLSNSGRKSRKATITGTSPRASVSDTFRNRRFHRHRGAVNRIAAGACCASFIDLATGVVRPQPSYLHPRRHSEIREIQLFLEAMESLVSNHAFASHRQQTVSPRGECSARKEWATVAFTSASGYAAFGLQLGPQRLGTVATVTRPRMPPQPIMSPVRQLGRRAMAGFNSTATDLAQCAPVNPHLARTGRRSTCRHRRRSLSAPLAAWQ
jgi:hypothetical protein